MDDSSRTPSELSRRRVVQLLGAGAVAAAAGNALTGTTAEAHSHPSSGLVAAVLDEVDVHTNAQGLKALLQNAGFEVIDLDPARAANAQAKTVHLIAFGSFANSGALTKYSTFVTNQRDSLQGFVKAGGVVLELAQPDYPGVGVSYLPVTEYQYDSIPMHAVRTDYDSNAIYPVDTGHSLVRALTAPSAPSSTQPVLTGRRTKRGDGGSVWTSWESIGAWAEMRVLLSCAPGESFPAALVEGKSGSGRYLISSLTIDKCYAADRTTAVESAAAIEDSHKFFHALADYVTWVRANPTSNVGQTEAPKAGPLVGHVDESRARIWARPGLNPATYPTWKCEVRRTADGSTVTPTPQAQISTDNDNTLLFDVTGLAANTGYTFAITPATSQTGVPFVPMTGKFTTAPAPDAATRVTLGFGSCAHTPSNSVWTRIIDKGCEGFVMLGDTPYADRGIPKESTAAFALPRARRTHREFLAAPGIDNLVRSMPTWGTWDDHDFGANGSDGNFAGKAAFRRAFVDYRANADFGHATGTVPDSTGKVTLLTGRGPGEGIHTSFRRGPIEVFLVDPRWFSNASANPRVCMGPVQKAWLFDRLGKSTATFKILASGMTWYDKDGPESDHWDTYGVEKAELFDFIRTNNVKGCVLLSGDIHVSRALKNNGDPQVGYDLWEFVVSPLHDKTGGMDQASTPPGLMARADTPRTFLKLEADTRTGVQAKLTATWINDKGEDVISPIVLSATALGHSA
ncbi:alkaline phosphatase D family protein [Kitasatospora sp. NPDC059327]|uniref:alkaline phosphatase D family protein n=1 Tax=Kitasatospora sp. NPDC059327 TaxID=3346803 RepID=UPI0036AB6325